MSLTPTVAPPVSTTPRSWHWLPRTALTAASLAVVLVAVNGRREYLTTVLTTHRLAIEPGFEGLAVNTAIAILAGSMVVILLVMHSFARFVDSRWTGAGPSLARRPATLGVQLAAIALFGAAAATSGTSLPLARALPDVALLALLGVAAGFGLWSRRGEGRRERVLGAVTAVTFVLLTALAAGRWF